MRNICTKERQASGRFPQPGSQKPKGLKRGYILKGKYEILALIGEGGMSRVYLARDMELPNKQWAVKEVDRFATDPAGRPIEQTLTSEADLLSKLQHPAIVGIVDIEKTADRIYVVMDHVEGESLDKIVQKRGPQKEEDVQGWMLQICDALSYLHRQDPPIIYRDMKPNNIMLHPDGYVKLIDLGVAREYKEEQRQDTVAFGTTGYAAPEQYGKAQTDERADIYGLGATLWHLLGGTPPPVEFPLPDVRELNPSVGEGFADVIIPRCTELSRGSRYQSCAELAADLEVYPELTRAYKATQRHRVIAFGTAAVLAILLLIAGFACLGIREALVTQSYRYHMDVADANVQTDPLGAQEEYLAAIRERPDAVDAYKGLIGSYKLDGQFTPEEKRQFDEAYHENLIARQASPRFSELSYELGRLYWYFYRYGQTGTYEDNQITRIKASSDHFANAAQDASFDHHAPAQDHATIAAFVAGIDAAVMQGDEDEELYRGLWESLESLAGRIEQEPLEIVQLDSCVLIANSLEAYLNKFKSIGGVSEEAMTALARSVGDQLSALELTTEANEQLRNQTLERLRNETAMKMATAYAGVAAEEGR